MCEISVSGWFYYKEICYDAARSRERKTPTWVVSLDQGVKVKLTSSGTSSLQLVWSIRRRTACR